MALLTTTLMLASCTGATDRPSRPAQSPSATETTSGGQDVDHRAERLAELTSHLQFVWDGPAGYRYRLEATGTFVARASGRGSFRAGLHRQRSIWASQTRAGTVRTEFAANAETNSVVARGFPGSSSARFQRLNSAEVLYFELVFGPGAGQLFMWLGDLSELAEDFERVQMSGATGLEHARFRLPTDAWLYPRSELPPGVGRMVTYDVWFDSEKRITRIRGRRDDGAFDLRVRYTAFRPVELPALSAEVG